MTSPVTVRAARVDDAAEMARVLGRRRRSARRGRDPREPATLWVADPNPRAQAFYRKHGFAPDGAVQVDDGVREIRMMRTAREGTGQSK